MIADIDKICVLYTFIKQVFKLCNFSEEKQYHITRGFLGACVCVLDIYSPQQYAGAHSRHNHTVLLPGFYCGQLLL